MGVRAQRHDPRHRLVLTRAVRVVMSALAGRRLRDANVPYRLLRRDLWTDLEPRIGPDALAPSIMVAVGAAVRGYRITEVPVTHLPRAHGVSTLRLGRLARFSGRALLQVVRFRAALAPSPAPPAAIGVSGAEPQSRSWAA